MRYHKALQVLFFWLGGDYKRTHFYLCKRLVITIHTVKHHLWNCWLTMHTCQVPIRCSFHPEKFRKKRFMIWEPIHQGFLTISSTLDYLKDLLNWTYWLLWFFLWYLFTGQCISLSITVIYHISVVDIIKTSPVIFSCRKSMFNPGHSYALQCFSDIPERVDMVGSWDNTNPFRLMLWIQPHPRSLLQSHQLHTKAWMYLGMCPSLIPSFLIS